MRVGVCKLFYRARGRECRLLSAIVPRLPGRLFRRTQRGSLSKVRGPANWRLEGFTEPRRMQEQVVPFGSACGSLRGSTEEVSLPAMSVPCKFESSGLPVGLYNVATPSADLDVLAFG